MSKSEPDGMDGRPFYTTSEAAAILGYTERNIRFWCVEGRLGQKFGSVWLIPADDLRKILETKEASTTIQLKYPKPEEKKR